MEPPFNAGLVNVKVLDMKEPAKVSGGMTKQDLTIADYTCAAKLTLWEAYVGRLTEGNSYRLLNARV